MYSATAILRGLCSLIVRVKEVTCQPTPTNDSIATFRSDYECDWVRVRLSNFKEPSFIPVADQQLRMLRKRYSWDKSQTRAREQGLKSNTRTQSRTRSPI